MVLDATALERNLNLVYQILDITPNVIICVNLLDEAKKKGIKINLDKLSELLGVPVVGTIARKKKTLNNLLNTIYDVCTGKITCKPIKINCFKNSTENNQSSNAKDSINNDEEKITTILKKAKEISNKVCTYNKKDYNKNTRNIDKVVTSKIFRYSNYALIFRNYILAYNSWCQLSFATSI